MLWPLPHPDESLLLNQSGSHLLPLDDMSVSFSTGPIPHHPHHHPVPMPEINEEENEDDVGNASADMRNLLIGLRQPEAKKEALQSSVLPKALTMSVRRVDQLRPPSSSGGQSGCGDESVLFEPNEERDKALLACSTASYRDHRDSPVNPRVVSIQAERSAELQTPVKARADNEGDATVSDGGSGTPASEVSSPRLGDLLDGWHTNEMSTIEM